MKLPSYTEEQTKKIEAKLQTKNDRLEKEIKELRLNVFENYKRIPNDEKFAFLENLFYSIYNK